MEDMLKWSIESSRLCSDSSNRMMLLAGSVLKTEEEHLNIEMLTALIGYNASILLRKMEMYVLETNKLKMHATGVPTLKVCKIKNKSLYKCHTNSKIFVRRNCQVKPKLYDADLN